MGLIEKSASGSRIFLGIVNSQIRKKDREGNEEFFKAIAGKLTGITSREVQINGAPMVFYDIALKDGNDEYILSINRAGSVARSIVLTLASVKNFAGKEIRIEPWMKKGEGDREYTNVSVYLDGERLKWVTSELPEVKTVKVGSTIAKDDSKLIEFIDGLVNGINQVIAVENAHAVIEAAAAVDDLPEDIQSF